MAGHSQFKNIMHRKGAQDAKRAKVFSKLIRELTVAVRSGLPDPDMNPRLRAAVAAARGANMPKDNIKRAIKRASGDGGGLAFEEIRYEGYGAGGVAVIVETLTDNRNRTAAEVRAAFTKFGGSLGETNSVAFQFKRVGSIRYSREAADDEEVFEAAIATGAEDCVSAATDHEVQCAPNIFNDVRDRLEARLGMSESASLVWQPISTVPVNEKQASSLFKMFGALEDSDDVQQVSSNFEVSDGIIEKLSL